MPLCANTAFFETRASSLQTKQQRREICDIASYHLRCSWTHFKYDIAHIRGFCLGQSLRVHHHCAVQLFLETVQTHFAFDNSTSLFSSRRHRRRVRSFSLLGPNLRHGAMQALQAFLIARTLAKVCIHASSLTIHLLIQTFLLVPRYAPLCVHSCRRITPRLFFPKLKIERCPNLPFEESDRETLSANVIYKMWCRTCATPFMYCTRSHSRIY